MTDTEKSAWTYIRAHDGEFDVEDLRRHLEREAHSTLEIDAFMKDLLTHWTSSSGPKIVLSAAGRARL